MQIAQDVTYLSLPWMVSLTKVRGLAFRAIDTMYQLAYDRHTPGSFRARADEDDSTFTPNELRLLSLVSDIMCSKHDVCIVHCGDRTFLFGTHDEYSNSAAFNYEAVHFIE